VWYAHRNNRLLLFLWVCRTVCYLPLLHVGYNFFIQVI
jgi:hypothetical protein